MIFLELLLTFLKIGVFTFGGGYAMIPLIQESVVSQGWVSEPMLIDFIAISESTPGPFAINISTYIGSEMAGIPGAVFATLGVVIPSFVIILIVAHVYDKFKTSKGVKGVMSGLKPAVVGLIGSAALSIALTVFFPAGFSTGVFTSASFFISLVIFVIALLLILKKKVHPIIVVGISAAIGIAGGYIFLG